MCPWTSLLLKPWHKKQEWQFVLEKSQAENGALRGLGGVSE